MSADPRPPLFVLFRPMVEVDGDAAATEAAAAIQDRLEAIPGVVSIEMAALPRPYGKIEGTWEVTFHLHPGVPLADVFSAIMALAPNGWTGDFGVDVPDGLRWAVWSRPVSAPDDASAGSVLVLSSVAWAELGAWDGVVYTGPFESADD